MRVRNNTRLIQDNEIQKDVDVLSPRTLILVIFDIFDFKETSSIDRNRYKAEEINGLYKE
ncbi:MAG: hypothetical protein ACPKPY_13365 [Nitrososphaeraceae archaeon]